MSDVINEAAFMGSENTMANIVAPRTQEEVRDKKADEKKTLRAALIPAASVLTEIIDAEIAATTNLATYKELVDTAAPDGNGIYQEFRARELYSTKLRNLRKLIEDATKGVKDE